MRHELELARLNQELELERVRVSAREVRDDVSTESGISGRSVVDHRLVQISMPRFDDRVESIDDFLTQFEKLAQAHGIPTQHWAINVSAFLQGSARDVYHSLSSNESDEYAVLKKALLRHYRLTAENYRKMFRESTKKGSETHSQFHARVRGLFERWIKMAEVEQTYEGLREIILKEHVLNTYRKDLTIFLAEREHRTLEEIADMAERYELAHPKSGGSGLGDKPRNNEPRRMGEGGVANRNRQGEGKVGGVSSVKGSDPKPRPNSPSHREFTDRRTAPTCYNCKRPGHLARDCRSRKAVQVNAIAKKDSVSIVNSMAMNVATGTVNDNPVKILYDTGCNVAALVDQKFVRSEDYTGENVEVVYANKQREILPLAMIDIVSPYVKGRIEAACTKNGIHDVILGCRYVIPQPNPEGCLAVTVAAVETRAQRRQPKPISLGSTTMPVSNVLPEELKKLQQEDISLTALHKHVESETMKGTDEHTQEEGQEEENNLVNVSNENFNETVDFHFEDDEEFPDLSVYVNGNAHLLNAGNKTISYSEILKGRSPTKDNSISQCLQDSVSPERFQANKDSNAVGRDFPDDIANLSLDVKPNRLYKLSKMENIRTIRYHKRRPVKTMDSGDSDIDSDDGCNRILFKKNQISSSTSNSLIKSRLTKDVSPSTITTITKSNSTDLHQNILNTSAMQKDFIPPPQVPVTSALTEMKFSYAAVAQKPPPARPSSCDNIHKNGSADCDVNITRQSHAKVNVIHKNKQESEIRKMASVSFVSDKNGAENEEKDGEEGKKRRRRRRRRKKKVEQLQNAARPTTKTEVRSFLGLAGYYRRYVPNFSAIAGPLSDLTKKRSPTTIVWTEACEKAFTTLKDRLTSEAVVHLPDLNKDFVLRTDACATGLGAVLLQEHDGVLFPVAYGSRKLSEAEKNYSVSERECLAIVFGVSRFGRYLYGRKFILETDHQPLAYLAQAKLSNGRLMRWSLFLQQYQMQIRYVKGSENVGADFMSRSTALN